MAFFHSGLEFSSSFGQIEVNQLSSAFFCWGALFNSKFGTKKKQSQGRNRDVENFSGADKPESIKAFNESPLGVTVDGRNPANQLIGSVSHYLLGFLHPRWCRISAIHSTVDGFFNFTEIKEVKKWK